MAIVSKCITIGYFKILSPTKIGASVVLRGVSYLYRVCRDFVIISRKRHGGAVGGGMNRETKKELLNETFPEDGYTTAGPRRRRRRLGPRSRSAGK